MRITKARLDAYRREIAGLADEARSQLIGMHDWSGLNLSVADARDEVIEAIKDVLGIYGSAAQDVAVELFEEVYLAETGKRAEGLLFDDIIDPLRIEKKVRYFARKLAEGDVSGFKDDTASLIEYYVKREALECMERNCGSARFRFARVPTGRETCSWCFMLCSRGFVYKSEKSAGGEHGFHNNCDCILVPGIKGVTSIQGYDPKGMADRFAMCQETLGGREQLKRDWDDLPAEERRRWLKGRKSQAEAREAYYNWRIRKEVETRDWNWLYTRKTPSPRYESKRALKELKPHEKITRDTMAANGFSQFVLERSNLPKSKTPDCLLGSYEVRVDWKSPQGSGFNSIDQLMRDAGKKADLAIIDLQEGRSVISLNDAISYFKRCGTRRGIREAIFIDYDRTLYRVKI